MKILQEEVARIQIPADEDVAVRAWNQVLRGIKQKIDRGDDPSKFLTWREICRTMHLCGRAGHVIGKLKALRDSPDFATRWKPVLREDRAGNPSINPHWENSSGTLVMHAYHVMQLERLSGIRIWEMPYIFEFGGGYGSMARLIHKLGFDGDYIIFDMSVISALQRYYFRALSLKNCAPDCVSTLDDVITRTKRFDLSRAAFLATMSFSETPLPMREPFEKLIGNFGLVFIAFADSFYGIDNLDYFSELTGRIDSHAWEFWTMDNRKGKYYLIGRLDQ